MCVTQGDYVMFFIRFLYIPPIKLNIFVSEIFARVLIILFMVLY